MEDMKFLLTDEYAAFSEKVVFINKELKVETEGLKQHYEKYVAKKKEFNTKKKKLEVALQVEVDKWEEYKKKAVKSDS